MASATQNRRWVRSSVQEWLEASFPTVNFNYGNQRTSLDELFKGLPDGTPVVLVDWLKRSGTILNDARLITWPVQLTVIDKTTTDHFGTNADSVVTAISTALAGKRIPLLDYTDISNPATTGHSLIVLNVSDDDQLTDEMVWAVAITFELQYIEHQ